MTRPRGGYIGFNRVTSVSEASGIWTLREAEQLKRDNLWPTTGDVYWSSVKLLMNMDGSGASFSDHSSQALAVTANGGVTQSTDQSKYGGKSAYFDGDDAYLTFGAANLSFGSGDFAFEMWIYPTTTQTSFLGDWRLSGNAGPAFYMINNILNFFDGASNVADSTAVANNAWTHVAAARSGSTLKIYRAGSAVATLTTSANMGGSGNLSVGFHNNTFFAGYIDDLRITIGSARGYTGSTITVPTSAFPAGS